MKIKISKVEFREDLYPRFKPNQSLIQRYSDSVEQLPPIKINQNNILIDGFHRLKAHILAGRDEIKTDVIETKSEAELEILAYKYNATHGAQLSSDEKRSFAQKKVGLLSTEEIAKTLSVSPQMVRVWTKSQREALIQERDRKIIELYLRAENTQEQIVKRLEEASIKVDQKTISNVIRGFRKNEKNFLFPKESKLFLYTVWPQHKQDSEASYFGAFPEVYMENLIHYHTRPFDVVVDPFAGSGTTVRVCQKMFRRYYASDRKVFPGMESEIKEHDITTGYSKTTPKADLLFIDPPYWAQAKNKYSKDSSDLANMNLEDFYKSMQGVLTGLSAKKIALVIQPTQYANNFVYEDHVLKFHGMLFNNYIVEARYILPYSTQQYNAQMVEKAKKEKKCLVNHRDLIVWVKNDKTRNNE